MTNFIVGLTGGIGSGKSTVTALFEKLGIDVIDADIVARDVVVIGSPALLAIESHFGAEFINKQGHLNRSLLRRRIFSNEEDKAWLNALMHPLINQALHQQLTKVTSPYCILVAPLLLENKLHKNTNTVLVIDVTEEEQLLRTVKRDNSNEIEVRAIISSQMPRQERLSYASNVLNNSDADLSKLKQSIKSLHQHYLQLSSQ